MTPQALENLVGDGSRVTAMQTDPVNLVNCLKTCCQDFRRELVVPDVLYNVTNNLNTMRGDIVSEDTSSVRI